MDTRRFTEHPRVYHTIRKLQEDWDDREVSDIVDGEGNQYVDLVMEGGGVLGIALLGYTYTLEQVGIRFLGVGGTSAGSINALLLAAVREKHHPKSETLIEELAGKDFYDFVDGGRRVRSFIDLMLRGPRLIPGVLRFLKIRRTLWRRLGLNPGEEFHGWITGILANHGIADAGALMERLASVPPGGLRRRSGEPLTAEEAESRLALIAAEVSTETKVELPRMARLYWADPKAVNPADFVRASMSIPGFFQPFVVEDIPREGALDRWRDMAGYKNRIPEACYFIDGGVMSNFPVDIFHVPGKVPLAPTFGAKLGHDDRYHPIDGPLSLTGAIFDSARHTLDYDFILRNPDYRQLVTYIDTGDHNWLNFRLSDEEKVDLFRCGVESAATFLRTFDWEGYKKTRKHLAEAAVAAEAQRRAQPPEGGSAGEQTVP